MIKRVIAQSIINLLEDLFPLSSATEWDKVGIQVGSAKKIVSNVVVAFDLTKEVMDFAVDSNADMIIVYHPFLFNESDFDSSGPKQKYKRKIYDRLITTGMIVYSMHTAFDKSLKGMPLAFKRKLSSTTKISPITGIDYGMIVEWEDTISDINNILEEQFGIFHSSTNVVSQVTPIKNFALLNGSADIEDLLITWRKNDIDLILTSDIKWSDKVTLNEEGVHFMEVSHFIEYIFIEHIASYLKRSTNNISIFNSKPKEIIKNTF